MKDCILSLALPLFTVIGFSQSNGDFRFRQTGNWNSSDTWGEFQGSWSNAANTPDNTDGAITILNTHTVTVTADVTIDKTAVDSGGVLEVQEPNTLTIADGAGGDDLTVAGTLALLDGFGFDESFAYVSGQLVNTGTVTVSDPGLSTLTFQAGSTYEHLAVSGSSWNATFTILIIGVTGFVPSNLDQTFSHFPWNCSVQSGTLFLGLTGSTTSFACNFTVGDTNGRILALASSTGAAVDFQGDLIVSGSLRFARIAPKTTLIFS